MSPILCGNQIGAIIKVIETDHIFKQQFHDSKFVHMHICNFQGCHKQSLSLDVKF